MKTMCLRPALVALLLSFGVAAPAAAAGDVSCRLDFDMTGWSVFFKSATGSGRVSCSNGQSTVVRIRAKGGGLTVGKSRIRGARGEFSGVRDLREVLGTYVALEAHAGAVKSSQAQAMTKGDVSFALAGTGDGWDLGVAVGSFTIEAR